MLSLPAGFFLLHWIVRKDGPALSVSLARIVTPILLVLMFSAIGMCIYNRRVTGSAFLLPYQIHEKSYATAPLFIWQKPFLEPEYHHRIMREFQTTYALSFYQSQQSIAGFIRNKLHLLFLLVFGTMNFLAIPSIPLIVGSATVVSWIRKDFWARRAVAIYFFFIFGLIMETFMGLHYIAPVVALNYFFALNAMRFWRAHNRQPGQLILWLVPTLAAVLLPISLYGRMKQIIRPHGIFSGPV